MRNLSKVLLYLLTSILAFSTLLAAQQTLPFTTIQDSLNNPDGTPFSGTVYITWPTYQIGNITVAAGKQSVLVTGGNLNVSLTPTDRMTPQGTFYTVSYVTNAGNPVSNVWSVPTSNTPITLNRIQPVALSAVGGSGGGGLAAPGSTGLMKYTGSNTTAPATPSDILNVFRSAPSPGTYVAGDGTLKPAPVVPTNVSAFTNDANYASSATLALALAAAQAASLSTTGSPGIVKTTGTGNATAAALPSDVLNLFSGTQNSSTYLAGDATLKPFPAIPSVPNNVSAFSNDANYATTAAVAAAQSASLAKPGVAGVVKATGTGNGTARASAADITSMFTGTANSATYLAGDGTLKTLATVGNSGSYSDLLNRPDNQADSNLATLQTALANASTTPVSVIWIGDSTSSCSYFDCGVAVYDPNDVTPNLVKNYLQGLYGNHGSGLVPISIGSIGNTATSVPSQSWTVSGTLNVSPNFGPRQITPYVGYTLGILSGGSQTASITGSGTSIVIYGASYTDSSTGCAVSIDGSAKTPFGGTTSGTWAAISTSYALSAGTHTLTLTAPVSGNCYIYGAEFVNGTSGVSVHNLSRAGHASNGFGATPSDQLPWLSAINSNSGPIGLVVIQLGTNDAYSTNTTTQAQFQGYMSNIVAAFQAINPSVGIIFVQPWSTTFSTGSVNLKDSNLSAAFTYLNSTFSGSSYVNMLGRWASVANAQTVGYLSATDGVHETDAGARDFAEAVEDRIIPNASLYGASNRGGLGPNAAQGGKGLSLLTQPTGNKILLSGSNYVTYPTVFDMGVSYSTTNAAAPKLLVYHTGKDAGTPGSNTYFSGIGFSAQGSNVQTDFLTYGAASNWNAQAVFTHKAGSATIETLRINPNVGSGTGVQITTSGTINAGAVNTSTYQQGGYQAMSITGAASGFPYITAGPTTPGQGIFVASGFQLQNRSLAGCNSGNGGLIMYQQGAAGIKDAVQICAKDATNTWAWRTIY